MPVVRRLRVLVHGVVQGVGFRPFVYRLATDLGLSGWVRNSGTGVFIELEGDAVQLDRFLSRLISETPPNAWIQNMESSYLDPIGCSGFQILESLEGPKTTLILPDIATCPQCLEEVFDPGNRRFRYPFTNCTHCGPRYSIIRSLPYDRPNTTMADFTMCPQCRKEYEDPKDRRFHAQPNACPVCGPRLEFLDEKGTVLAREDEALSATAARIREGQILAVKGIGGFHLMVDARNSEAIKELRLRKRREEKPFALMYPSIEEVRADCTVSPAEERLLSSPQCPIVLLERRASCPQSATRTASDLVAPRNPYLGVMLPYTPLHHLLLADLGFPIVATSGNLSEEPICTDEAEAIQRLSGIADGFLVHNRPIERHVDDSIVRVVLNREMILRRARGYAPLPVPLRKNLKPVLGVGALLKNTVAVAHEDQVYISQHIGDLENEPSFEAFQKTIRTLTSLREIEPQLIAHDLHPDYLSSRYARETGKPTLAVQHHWAHVLSCAAENEVDPPFLGVSWDGTGYGTDGTVWGGEFLSSSRFSFERTAHLRTFPLAGGDRAAREPRRSAVGVLYDIFQEKAFEILPKSFTNTFTPRELSIIKTMLVQRTNTPPTSSAGRLFDAVSALLGIRYISRYEGQAAMELEFLAQGDETEETYPFGYDPQNDPEVKSGILDWEPMIRELLQDLDKPLSLSRISAKFHNTLVEMICAVARRSGFEKVLLTGGCFQNRYLTERTVTRLQEDGFRVYWHQRVPPNDGGVALGQVVAACWREEG